MSIAEWGIAHKVTYVTYPFNLTRLKGNDKDNYCKYSSLHTENPGAGYFSWSYKQSQPFTREAGCWDSDQIINNNMSNCIVVHSVAQL